MSATQPSSSEAHRTRNTVYLAELRRGFWSPPRKKRVTGLRINPTSFTGISIDGTPASTLMVHSRPSWTPTT